MDPEARDASGMSALHHAAKKGSAETVAALLEGKADADAMSRCVQWPGASEGRVGSRQGPSAKLTVDVESIALDYTAVREAEDEDGDAYGKQVPLSRAIPLWGGLSGDGFAPLLFHPSKKTNQDEWSKAVRDARVTEALRFLNPKKKS